MQRWWIVSTGYTHEWKLKIWKEYNKEFIPGSSNLLLFYFGSWSCTFCVWKHIFFNSAPWIMWQRNKLLLLFFVYFFKSRVSPKCWGRDYGRHCYLFIHYYITIIYLFMHYYITNSHIFSYIILISLHALLM